MSVSTGEILAKILASPAPRTPAPAGRWERRLVIGTALAAGIWVLIFKLQCFFGLETTSDLYSEIQQTTSWLDGRIYQDNCFGNILAMHTYFLSPLLAVLTVPFGAVGLFIALGLTVALQIGAIVRIQRLLGVNTKLALFFGLAVALMPLAMHAYQDTLYGFHLELLEPALALWLAYFLLARSWRGSLALTFALVLLKEDAPLLVAVVAVMVASEDFIRSFGRNGGPRWNTPAAVMLLLAVLSVPVLLYIIKTQQVAGAVSNLARVQTGGAGITSTAGLVQYVISHLGPWLRSSTVNAWLGLSLAGTFGLIMLRPHFLVVGVITTLTAWLVQEDWLWAARVVQAVGFFQLTAVLGFASACALFRNCRTRGSKGKIIAGLLAISMAVATGYGFRRQWQAVPKTGEIYSLDPVLPVSMAERKQADRLFETYRRDAKKNDPVVASGHLFRYAHDRNLFWYDRLAGRPAPVWILWDRQQRPIWDLWTSLRSSVNSGPADYRLTGSAGRFLLLRRRSSETAPPAPPPVPAITGEASGAVRLRLKFPAAFATASEPLLAVGDGLFLVRYFDDGRLAVGWQEAGAAASMSEPIAYDSDRVYELELFSGGLLPAAEHQDLLHIAWEGREVLSELTPAQGKNVAAEIQLGRNPGRAAGVDEAFTGEMSDARRGGIPVPTRAPAAGADFGAVRLVVDLSGVAAGPAEPMVVAGVAGDATLGYLRLLPDGQAKVGAEFWGHGAIESEPFALADRRRVEVVFHLPTLYPPARDWRWGRVPVAEREESLALCRIVVDGVRRLDKPALGPVHRQIPVVSAANPVGGSWVARQFSVAVIETSRQPLGRP